MSSFFESFTSLSVVEENTVISVEEDHSSNNKNRNSRSESVVSGIYSSDHEENANTASENTSEDEYYTTPEYVPGSFEGPEKTMEVVFRPNVGAKDGLRSLSRAQLDILCTKAKCSILSQISNSYLDAYVLSESSLFVYKHRLIMKTCGTTTLLRCLGKLLEFADDLSMKLEWVGYSRKNLNNPTAQFFPHSNFDDEMKYIETHSKLQDRLKGSGYVLGPITGDHLFVYVADHSHIQSVGAVERYLSTPSDRTINIMMFDMDPSVANIFFQRTCSTGKEMTAMSGISSLCPGAIIDETAFTPCGYSMNAILHDAYYTIHITPEAECSYASFETNACLKNYDATVRNVLNVFKPKRFVMVLFGDEDDIHSIPSLPTDARNIVIPTCGTYKRSSLASRVETELSTMMACYTLNTNWVDLSDVRVRGYSLVD